MKNLLTDIAGVRVGHADDATLASGVTAIIFDKPAVASIDVRGGAPGTRESALLDPVATVDAIDAITLGGGSAFGLDAGGGVQGWLAERGRGFKIRGTPVPIVPGAIIFDLLNGGNKAWGRFPPYRDLGYAAALAASDMLAKYDARNPAALKRLVGGGAKLFRFPKDVMEGAFKESMALYSELNASNPTWKKVYDDFSSFRRDANLWFRFTESGFDDFMQQQKL